MKSKLHNKKCKSTPFHEQFLNIDKMTENNTKRINDCFNKSSIPNVAIVSQDIKKELIENGIISSEYSKRTLIFRRK